MKGFNSTRPQYCDGSATPPRLVNRCGQCGCPTGQTCNQASGVCTPTGGPPPEVCTPSPEICTDGQDNDCDSLRDCADSDCDGSITGFVRNQDNQLLAPADVLLKRDLTTVSSTTTQQRAPEGRYSFSNVNCGAYNLVASYTNYVPRTVSISLAPRQTLIQDFTLTLGTACERDCTFANDNLVHASCDGINGCSFCDSTSKAACDLSQVGWLRDYDSTQEVECPSGCPKVKIEIPATVTCLKGDTLVKMYRIITYNGKPVRLVVAMCG